MDIIVIGGRSDGGQPNAPVEVLNTHSQCWSTLTSLPQPESSPSATVCGNQLYVIGANGRAYVCSLQALVTGSRPIQSQVISPTLVWTTLPPPPVSATAATLCGELVIIGGYQTGLSNNSILQLVDRRWVKVGSLSSAREKSLAVSPSPDKMIVVGGWKHTSSAFIPTTLDSVELCTCMYDNTL